jgi:hypothetical protein
MRVYVSAQICAFFCGIESMQPWYYVNVSNITTSNVSDLLNDVSVNSVPTLVLASSTTPFMATAIFYALICIKMNHSKRVLDSLEVAAFNKQKREVGL